MIEAVKLAGIAILAAGWWAAVTIAAVGVFVGITAYRLIKRK